MSLATRPHMRSYDIDKLSDDELLARVDRVYRRSRECAAELVRLLIKVEERRLHLTTAHPSLFEFCVRRLGMSNGSAHRYITATRLAVRFPQIVERLARGALHLSSLPTLRDYLTPENVDELLERIRGRTRFEVEEIVASLSPRPDMPSRMRKIATPHTADSITSAKGADVRPMGDARYRVQFTVDRELRDDIEHVRDLMRHSNPSGDLARLFQFCVRAGLERLKSQRLGSVRERAPRGRDRTRRPASKKSSSSGIPRAVRRAVFERDGERCTYRDSKGRRCPCTTLLELDHIVTRGHGGADTVDNLRVRCRPHNQLHAEQTFGKEYIAERIRNRKLMASRRSRTNRTLRDTSAGRRSTKGSRRAPG